ncbi:conserved Plasmodium protein, unknown function [Plasmodium sp. gorilla clade G2]|uniref:conserved Plasmodium protein, unknown function n=1 Tax=Plasmodium sp. gorilla clade G2 TaxID=880535 RepID=UPI000D21F506|nr:conserved Plasmodium protein, unknown function [Plasmodium sp. gorilla clade G2]SOV15836.1 conserved Plasmodium protein, unknown function [Plasmodium sp. gorilla clade G2]
MKEGDLKNYILFEEENNIRSDRFCYDYSNPSPTKKTPKHFTSYKDEMNKNSLLKRSSRKQKEFKYDITGLSRMCNDRYIDMKMNQIMFLRSLILLQNKLNTIAMNNINNYITTSHDSRRHNIPMLWLHDNKTVYSM